MNNGWIKVYRKILDKGYYKRSAYVHLWLHLLLSANHEPNEFIWNGKPMIVNEGQLLTGRKELTSQTGIPETTIERILDFLEKDKQIGQQKTTKFRLITIINWKIYQSVDNKRTTNGQQTDTNKNDKNDKNIITIAASPPAPFSLKEEIKKLEDSKRRDLNIIALFMEEKKPDIRTKEQFIIAIKRHLRAANLLKSFDDDQILKAVRYAKKEYGEIWQLETVLKIITK